MMPKIKYFIMDVDGTLIDRKIYMGEEGELCKAYIAFCSGIDYSAEKGLSTPFSSKLRKDLQSILAKTEKMLSIFAGNVKQREKISKKRGMLACR